MVGETVQVAAAPTVSATAGRRVAVGGFAVGLVLAAALLALAAFGRLGKPFDGVFATWSYAAMFILAAIALVGHVMNGRFAGFLITEGNVMSASRAQWALWFVAVASTYLALAVARLAAGAPPRVEVAEGIVLATMASGASLAAAPVLSAQKARLKVADKTVEAVKADLDEDEKTELRPRGALWGRRSAKAARLADIFDGDELGDGASLDASKLQMLLLTVVLVFLYLLEFFRSSAATETLPDVVSGTMAAVLGVSHAGYLGSKLPQRTALG